MVDDHADSGLPASNSKSIGEKRAAAELGERHEGSRKRTKMRDLVSVLKSHESNPHNIRRKETDDRTQSSEGASLVTNAPLALDLDTFRAERSGSATLPVKVNPVPRSLDLNSEACLTNVSAHNCVEESAENCNEVNLLKKKGNVHDSKCVSSEGLGLDLNAEYVIGAGNQGPCCPRNSHDNLKTIDVSECASTTGPAMEKDPLRVWKEMKQNGFLSSSHGGISIQSGFISSSHGGIPVPKQRGRKSKSDVIKKKMELAKREQVDRFTKIAAPSGLLNGLNPGIINHVRNRKQVHSIIEALVRSEKLENDQAENKQSSHLKTGSKEVCNASASGIHRLILSQGNGGAADFYGSKQTVGCPISGGENESSMLERMCHGNAISNSIAINEDDTLALKLSSSTKASDESSSFSNEESENINNVCSLSIKAASVASQWLELLNQDIKGRLSALRRSKKRVRAVISTELPFLIAKEFSSNRENDPSYITKNSSDGLSNSMTEAMHKSRWTALFDQMDKTLSEEEKQLEGWLNQVKEMQLHCDRGLNHFHWKTSSDIQRQGASENYTSSAKAYNSEMELAVRAVAASMYSTCNFLMSKEEPCF